METSLTKPTYTHARTYTHMGTGVGSGWEGRVDRYFVTAARRTERRESGREQLVKPPLTALTPLVATLGAVLLSLVLWKKKQEVTVKGIEVTYSEVR